MYKRILIKLSGEAFSDDNSIYNINALENIVRNIIALSSKDIEIAIVIGAGNLWRGKDNVKYFNINNVDSDYIGMLGTAMNALVVKGIFEKNGVKCKIQSSVNMIPFIDIFNKEESIEALSKKEIIIFACGTGNPFFTTDTAAALRALEIKADILLKATKTDGVYSANPDIHSNVVKRYKKITFDDAIKNQLEIIDLTALFLCKNHKLPIIVLNFLNLDKVLEILQGKRKELFTYISS